MKLTIPRNDLSRLIAGVGKVVESRNTVPILSSVLLTATPNTLTVRGTDLDIEATASSPVSAHPGAVCVNAKSLAGAVAKMTGDISFSLEPGSLVLKSGNSRFSLVALPAEDFPSFADGVFDATFDIDLASLLAPVAFAASTEETRYYLNGVFLRGHDGQTVAVATDGHRLGRHIGAATSDFEGIIIPRKMVGLIPKGTVTVSVSKQKIRIQSGDFTITSKLIDGTYPDYERVIPTGNDKIASVDRDEMMKAVDRVSVISSERGRAVKLALSSGRILLTVTNPDSGSATDELVASYGDDDMQIGFNARYVHDVMSVLPSGPVTMAFSDGVSPSLFTSPAFDGLTLVAMPMRA